jgi:hypothetical protein
MSEANKRLVPAWPGWQFAGLSGQAMAPSEGDMSELSVAEASLYLILTCLALAGLLVWACYDAEQPRRSSYVRYLMTLRWMRRLP